MVAARVTHLLERDDVIPAEQVGFRRGHSAEENLGCLIPEGQDGWNRPPPRGRPSDGKTAARFVLTAYDFSRAYDVIDAETEDVPPSPTLPDHLDPPLPPRPSSACQVNGVRSHSRPFCAGLPQGSALAPTLFILWLADLVAALDAFRTPPTTWRPCARAAPSVHRPGQGQRSAGSGHHHEVGSGLEDAAEGKQNPGPGALATLPGHLRLPHQGRRRASAGARYLHLLHLFTLKLK